MKATILLTLMLFFPIILQAKVGVPKGGKEASIVPIPLGYSKQPQLEIVTHSKEDIMQPVDLIAAQMSRKDKVTDHIRNEEEAHSVSLVLTGIQLTPELAQATTLKNREKTYSPLYENNFASYMRRKGLSTKPSPSSSIGFKLNIDNR